MTGQKDCKKRSAINRARDRRVASDQVKRVLSELEAVAREDSRKTDPIVEQLKQCPEALKAGEMIGKVLDSLKHSQGNTVTADRYLPPAGAVIPPLA